MLAHFCFEAHFCFSFFIGPMFQPEATPSRPSSASPTFSLHANRPQQTSLPCSACPYVHGPLSHKARQLDFPSVTSAKVHAPSQQVPAQAHSKLPASPCFLCQLMPLSSHSHSRPFTKLLSITPTGCSKQTTAWFLQRHGRLKQNTVNKAMSSAA